MRRDNAGTWKLVATVFALAGAMPTVSSGQTRPADLPRATPAQVGMSSAKLDKVKSLVQMVLNGNQTADVGAVVLVARHGKVVQYEAFGKMDVDAGKPMRPDALFRLRSMSKPITTAAALLLLDEGRIRLDDPVSKYLPELEHLRVYAGPGRTVEARREMTIRDLMRHTSGLSYGYEGTPVDKLYSDNKIMDGTLADMVRKLGKLPLQDQPGTRFRYSFSTDVLGRLIEVVSGKPLDDFLRDRIFRPLDMRDTGFVVPSVELDRLTTSYRSDGKGTLKVDDAPATSHFRTRPRLLSGGGGLVSTARDYLRFSQMLLNGGELDGVRLLRPETVREMTTNQLPADALPISFFRGFSMPGYGVGLGMMVRLDTKSPTPDPAAGEYSWSGAASTFFSVAPGSDVIVIVLQQVEPINLGILLAVKPTIYAAIAD